MTTTTALTPRMIALIDGDTPTPAASDLTASRVRAPEIVERGRAYWIGPDATVSCWLSADLDDLADRLERAGWMARTGQDPAKSGLIVTPHADVVPRGPLQKNGHLFTLWEYAREAMLDTEGASA